MDIDQARTFLAITANGSFLEAARQLHLTQSTVSARIQRLEDDSKKTAQDYLDEQVKRLKARGIDVDAKVIFGLASQTLTQYAEKNGIDLIIIATHGRSGIREWFWGSVAERVLKTSKIPILMIRPDGCGIKLPQK